MFAWFSPQRQIKHHMKKTFVRELDSRTQMQGQMFYLHILHKLQGQMVFYNQKCKILQNFCCSTSSYLKGFLESKLNRMHEHDIFSLFFNSKLIFQTYFHYKIDYLFRKIYIFEWSTQHVFSNMLFHLF